MTEQVQQKPFAKIFDHPMHGQILLQFQATEQGGSLITTFCVAECMIQQVGEIPAGADVQAIFDNAAADQDKIFKMVEAAAASFVETVGEMQESEQVSKSLN